MSESYLSNNINIDDSRDTLFDVLKGTYYEYCIYICSIIEICLNFIILINLVAIYTYFSHEYLFYDALVKEKFLNRANKYTNKSSYDSK